MQEFQKIYSETKEPALQATIQYQIESLQEQLNNTIENNQQTLYNITESESGINERIQRERMAGISGQYGTRVQQDSQYQEVKKYTRQEYEQFEQSINPIRQHQLTNQQKTTIDTYKRQYNKDIVFFDGKNNQGYFGGASLLNKNKIYIDIDSAQKFGENKIINHEVIESDIAHNREISNDIIQPAIQKIIEDPKFQEQKIRFWEEQEGEIPSDYAIAKDVLCDRFAELKTGEKWDYDNVLSQETNMTIDYALENFEKKLYGELKKADVTTDSSSNLTPRFECNICFY